MDLVSLVQALQSSFLQFFPFHCSRFAFICCSCLSTCLSQGFEVTTPGTLSEVTTSPTTYSQGLEGTDLYSQGFEATDFSPVPTMYSPTPQAFNIADCVTSFDSSNQIRYICVANPGLFPILKYAEQLGKKTCEEDFQNEHWNCSGFSLLRQPNITKGGKCSGWWIETQLAARAPAVFWALGFLSSTCQYLGSCAGAVAPESPAV